MRPWLFGEKEPLHRPAADDVLLDDFVDVGLGDAAVPDVFGIDDDGRPLLALIEAAGLVGANAAIDAALGQRLLEGLLQRLGSGRIAAAARVAGLTAIAADEDVFVKGGKRNLVIQ
jgi:hypothetical protein